MKVPASVKISMMLLGLGGLLVLAPSARAQSEVSPDHFDGTDAWAVALAREPASSSAKVKPSATAKQAQNRQTRGANEVPQAQPAALVTVQKRRRAPDRKPENE